MKPVKQLWKKAKVTNADQFQCTKWKDKGKYFYELKVISVKVKPFEKLVLGIDLYPDAVGEFYLTDYEIRDVGKYQGNPTPHAKSTFTLTIPNGEEEKTYYVTIHFEANK